LVGLPFRWVRVIERFPGAGKRGQPLLYLLSVHGPKGDGTI
jgi:hypothetical protein